MGGYRKGNGGNSWGKKTGLGTKTWDTPTLRLNKKERTNKREWEAKGRCIELEGKPEKVWNHENPEKDEGS